jgi:hypothetical protein
MAQVLFERSVIRMLRVPAQDGTFDKTLLSCLTQKVQENPIHMSIILK